MSVPESMIDTIVREVMRQLAADRRAGGSASPASRPGASSTATIISERVVTEETLRDLGTTVTHIQLAPRSVMTPSARDYLSQHGIQVVSELPATSSAASPAGPATASNRQIIVISSDAESAEQFRAPGWALKHDTCEKNAVSGIQKTAGHDSGLRVMTISDLPSVTAYRLNRCRDCRAAVVTAQCDLDALFSAMRVNIVCVSTHGMPWTKRREILQRLEHKDGIGSSRVSVSSNGRGLRS